MQRIDVSLAEGGLSLTVTMVACCSAISTAACAAKSLIPLVAVTHLLSWFESTTGQFSCLVLHERRLYTVEC
jgi:hypothetical protein